MDFRNFRTISHLESTEEEDMGYKAKKGNPSFLSTRKHRKTYTKEKADSKSRF